MIVNESCELNKKKIRNIFHSKDVYTVYEGKVNISSSSLLQIKIRGKYLYNKYLFKLLYEYVLFLYFQQIFNEMT